MSFLLLALETLLAPFAALGVVLSFAFSRRRGLLSVLASELPERLGGLSEAGRVRLLGRRVYWLHAASAGEVGGLAPLDAWPCVARFLRETKPERLVLSETELWPSTILLAARAGLRPALINARMTARSLPRYRAASFLLRPALEALCLVVAQSDLDAESFRAIGVAEKKLTVAGNTKYDRLAAHPDGTAAAGALQILGWKDAPLFVAGSTHPVEEEQVLDGFQRAAAAVARLKLVLAPRHVERVEELLAALTARGVPFARLSTVHDSQSGVPVLVLDAMGALPSFWPRASVAFVGGTLVPVGGHNLLEPAASGAPVLFGPYTRHTEYPAVLLESGGGGFRIADGAELGSMLTDLLKDPIRARNAGDRARSVAEKLRGATARTLAALDGSGRK
jgi:3-deoxy-D-manno-octulosonic-acid transferase